MNLHAKLGLAAHGHDNPILGSPMSTTITQLMSILCPHLSWRMPCGMTWGRPAPAATTSVWYGVSLLGAGNSSVARALVAGAGGLPSTHCRSPAVRSGGMRRLGSCQAWRHAWRSSEGAKRAGGAAVMSALASLGAEAGQAADSFRSRAARDAARPRPRSQSP